MLKPTDDPEEADWVADVSDALESSSLRLQRPVRSTSGDWIFSGWTAWRWLEGDHPDSFQWPEVIEVTELFHQGLVGLPKPAFLDRRSHPWSVGDRAAWGEVSLPPRNEVFVDPLERLDSFLEPMELQSQVIHGDLVSNVLFEAGHPPAVIDFSPYYRPVGFALAIVVVDAIAWHGAGADLLDHASHIDDLDQLLARATIFRLVSADLLTSVRGKDWASSEAMAYESILGLIGT